MNDKELLMMAAKAAGLNYIDGSVTYDRCKLFNYEPCVVEWSPLTNDGDALRLAVKLQLDFYVDEKQAGCWINDFVCLVEDINGDPYTATRRAIVRAAADIGSKL